MPLVLVDPYNLPDAAGHDEETAQLLREAHDEAIHPHLIPVEFTCLEPVDCDGLAAALTDLDARLPELRQAQNARCRSYRNLPDAGTCIVREGDP